MCITLRDLRRHCLLKSVPQQLEKSLGKSWKEDAPIPLLRVLKVCGITHAIWALQATTALNQQIKSFIHECFEYSTHHYKPNDPYDSWVVSQMEYRLEKEPFDWITMRDLLSKISWVAYRYSSEFKWRNPCRLWNYFEERYRFWFGDLC